MNRIEKIINLISLIFFHMDSIKYVRYISSQHD